jgi:ammonium transporter, Amt family
VPTNADSLWILVAAGLVFLMQGGFLCLEIGLVQTRNVPVTALKNIIDWTMVSLAFFFVGFGLQYGDDIGGWIGTGYVALDGIAQSSYPGGVIYFLFQLGFAATAVTIVSGALAERVSFISYLAASFVMGALIYPVFGHWVWHEAGWLARLGFVDFAGSTVVHVVGGVMSLVGARLVGPRLGRFGSDGSIRAIRSHDFGLSVLGVALLWLGWWGFNGGSTLAFDDRVGGIILNTNLAGAAGGLVGFLHARFVQGSHVADKLVGGILGGLVAVTASCHLVSPLAALAIGAIASVIHNYAYDALLRYRIDDPVGAVPVHLACGLFGGTAVAIFAPAEALIQGRFVQLGVQLLGAAACIAWTGLTSYALFRLLRASVGLRVSPAEERSGLSMEAFAAPDEEAVDPEALRNLLRAGAE